MRSLACGAVLLSWSCTSGVTPGAGPSAADSDTETTDPHTDVDDSDETDVIGCGPGWPGTCVVRDGYCWDPQPYPGVQVQSDDVIDQLVASWGAQSACGPLTVTPCGSGSVAVALWGDSETPEVDVYSTADGTWLAGLSITDEAVPGPCGNRVWAGDEALRTCGIAALTWVQDRFMSPCAPFGDAAACPETCVRDEREAGAAGP